MRTTGGYVKHFIRHLHHSMHRVQVFCARCSILFARNHTLYELAVLLLTPQHRSNTLSQLSLASLHLCLSALLQGHRSIIVGRFYRQSKCRFLNSRCRTAHGE